jgi:hypothetical protein
LPARHVDVFCPGCGTSSAIDLRTVDRHLLASVGTLALGLRCSWCPGSAPMPKLIGLFTPPPARRPARDMPQILSQTFGRPGIGAPSIDPTRLARLVWE